MPTNAVLAQDCESFATATPSFRLSLAQTMDDVAACQRLRYLVFNCELGEGLSDSHDAGLDRDRFDLICDHLMVHDAATHHLVGTYRMQTGYRAKGNLGYYSEQLFDLTSFEPIRGEILELGRACVREDYRNTTALFMLWKGIASYAALCNARYMIGCSSITSQNEADGLALYRDLCEKYLVAPSFRTEPKAAFRCHESAQYRAQCESTATPHPPRLFRAYLDLSARLCGPPAIDRDFRTIDFLTLLDVARHPRPPPHPLLLTQAQRFRSREYERRRCRGGACPARRQLHAPRSRWAKPIAKIIPGARPCVPFAQGGTFRARNMIPTTPSSHHPPFHPARSRCVFGHSLSGMHCGQLALPKQ